MNTPVYSAHHHEHEVCLRSGTNVIVLAVEQLEVSDRVLRPSTQTTFNKINTRSESKSITVIYLL